MDRVLIAAFVVYSSTGVPILYGPCPIAPEELVS